MGFKQRSLCGHYRAGEGIRYSDPIIRKSAHFDYRKSDYSDPVFLRIRKFENPHPFFCIRYSLFGSVFGGGGAPSSGTLASRVR